MLKPIFDKLEIFKDVFIEINISWLNKNSDLGVLYNIIQSEFLLNSL